MLRDAGRALVLGIGGGGDVVGALAVGRQAEQLGTPFEVGGIAWERWSIDPHPGPRPLEEVEDVERLVPEAGIVGAGGRARSGAVVSEAGVARHLGRGVALIDAGGGPLGAARGIAAAADRLDCDLVVLCDVGGDAVAIGDEPGLASPLCDAVMLAAAAELDPGIARLGCIFGPGCDGELTAGEVLARFATFAADRRWLGAAALDPEIAAEVEAAAELVPTEASLQAARCARGETGPTEIRAGTRTLELGPIGALTLYFSLEEPLAAVAPLAEAVRGTDSIAAAGERLGALGLRTELDYERERAAGDR